jgi:signal transduction histidine kinase
MTRRLLLSYLGLAVFILLVLEIPLGVIVAHHERATAVSFASRDATGLAVESEEDLEDRDGAGLRTLLESYHDQTGAELAVVAAGGRIVASVDGDGDNDAVTLDRSGLDAALAGRASTVLRTDEGRPVAAAAAPIGSSDEPIGAVVLLSPVGAYADHATDIWLGLGGLGVGILVLTGLIGLGLARSFSRPLAQLEAAVADFGEGRLATRAAVERGPEEIRDLAGQFNLMADRLEGLVSAQTRFVADASHQLRSPLTALRLRLENLEAELDDDAGDALAAAGREVARLSRLVDGLLTLTRADGPAPQRHAVDVGEVIAERCDAWAALAAERRVSLERGGPVTHARASLVPGDLDQILDNLLANALDASPAGTTIEVTLRPGRRERLSLHVTDHGPGMDEEDRARAFDRFWQGPGARGGHSGLGLAIVRQLAHRNGLDVVLDPTPGGGLDAVVHLRRVGDRPTGVRGGERAGGWASVPPLRPSGMATPVADRPAR